MAEIKLDAILRALVIMGVSGCGKSTLAALMAERSGIPMIEGDAFHPAANIAKMSAGIPLGDADRQLWLERVAEAMHMQLHKSPRVIATCSALKLSYRDMLRQHVPDLGFVYLALTPQQALERVTHRPGHFMPASLVESQFRDLEPPSQERGVLTLAAVRPPEILCDEALTWWQQMNGHAASCLTSSASPPR